MNSNDFLKRLRQALGECRALLARVRAGAPAFASEWDLQTVVGELERMEREVTGGTLPPKGQRPTVIGDVVTGRHPDSSGGWPFDEPLAEEVAKLADLYRRRV